MLIPLLAIAMSLPLDSFKAAPRAMAAETLRQAMTECQDLQYRGLSGLSPLVSGGLAAQEQLSESYLATKLAESIQAGRWRAVTDSKTAAKWLERELDRFADDLQFEPTMEAELPMGFPAPTPVRDIQLKQYPSYRSVRAEMGALGSNSAFWKLFKHIQSNDIAMTTPVEMSYEVQGDQMRETKMAFLYGDPAIGQVGPAGVVEVSDAEANWVVSLGCRGYESDTKLANARAELLDWIATRPEYAVAGEMRVMSYNSPMVFGSRRYFEVQIPVRLESREVIDFARAAELDAWVITNDSVMGGRSTSQIQNSPTGTAVFAGTVSLANNGGFASVRSGKIANRLAGAQQIRVRAMGDGHTYKLRLYSPDAGGVAYKAPFETVAGDWQEHRFQLDDFVPMWRGQVMRNVPPLEFGDVTQLGFILSDGQSGDFRLELQTIRAL